MTDPKPTESMIERCTRQAHEESRTWRIGTSDSDVNPIIEPPWDKLPRWLRDRKLNTTRAVFAAAREPTQAMLDAYYAMPLSKSVDDGYRAMIDAILAEKP